LRGANGGGIYYGLKGHPERPCFISISFRDDCELLSDDFVQYYLGAFDRQVMGAPPAFAGEGDLGGVSAALAGTSSNALNEVGAFQVTSPGRHDRPGLDYRLPRAAALGDHAAGP
jgi:hypothetical protein